MHRALPLIALALALCLACDDNVTGSTVYVAREPFAISLASSGVTELRLTGINGNTKITGVSTADSVRITGVREVGSRESQADATMRLDDLQVQFGIQGNAIVVRTEQPGNQEGREYTVHYDVSVPKSFLLFLITANGTIGAVSMENSVNLQLANGTASLQGIYGGITADVANGGIDCDAVLPLLGAFDLNVGNGEIDVSIPTSTSAQFAATVANGEIRIFGLDLQEMSRSSTRVTGRLGSGQGEITLNVGNGTITARGVAP